MLKWGERECVKNREREKCKTEERERVRTREREKRNVNNEWNIREVKRERERNVRVSERCKKE